ncbi:delta-1-pyrroline-5-carboxylate dehydrogenase [Phakopsora pachyrhizi]|uniref:Multifunctional fusion protein n=1 Tax=Phakopsora pachyrhizi TaxID=170000 RepID=A0AAV0B6B1_PHAPC|nr:delta-1-pyrroline-5-carboxylate dehydrogenase [Phakopsora pachyrhizi]
MATNCPTLATFKLPETLNEPNQHYEPGSHSRLALDASIQEMRAGMPYEVGPIVDGIESYDGPTVSQLDRKSISLSLRAKSEWEALPFNDRAAIFLKAADLLSSPRWRYKIMAATILGQGKNAWQAEIDAAAEYAEELYAQQPPKNSPGVWNRVEYRPLEGFVYAISPFNFTAIGGNLAAAPALLGNVVLWKPSPMAVYSNYLTYKLLEEAGLPRGVIQFIPVAGEHVEKACKQIFEHPDFASLHFTGSTAVFRKLWSDIAQGVSNGTLRSYPRVVGETGGKNFHLIHSSAPIRSTVLQSLRAGFEYSGQKCSALSRLYVPESIWPEFSKILKEEVAKLKVGSPESWDSFVGPVISKGSFDKITRLIESSKKAGDEVIIGGTGILINPTVILTKNPSSITMTEELFGPVITVYVYPDSEFEKTCDLIDSSSTYALTGSIFSADRKAVVIASNKLRQAAGNFYINSKCTGAVVGQRRAFGGSRASGTNDKAGSINLLYRFVNARSIKEEFLPIEEASYPSNLI